MIKFSNQDERDKYNLGLLSFKGYIVLDFVVNIIGVLFIINISVLGLINTHTWGPNEARMSGFLKLKKKI